MMLMIFFFQYLEYDVLLVIKYYPVIKTSFECQTYFQVISKNFIFVIFKTILLKVTIYELFLLNILIFFYYKFKSVWKNQMFLNNEQ